MTSILCWILHFIPGLSLRTNEETEIIGIDDAEVSLISSLSSLPSPKAAADFFRDICSSFQMGEFAYDYVGLDPEAR